MLVLAFHHYRICVHELLSETVYRICDGNFGVTSNRFCNRGVVMNIVIDVLRYFIVVVPLVVAIINATTTTTTITNIIIISNNNNNKATIINILFLWLSSLQSSWSHNHHHHRKKIMVTITYKVWVQRMILITFSWIVS